MNTKGTEASQVGAHLRGLDRREWWFRWAGVVVTLGLTFTVVALAVHVFVREQEHFFGFNIAPATRGLVGLILLFNIYTLYQQWLLQRLRRQLYSEHVRSEQFERLALFDPLTGLYNRRIAQQRLPEEIARAQRSGAALTVLLLDLNDFKEINDCHGHSAGDRVLKEFAKRLQRSVRFCDVPIRWGGDEFLVLLPECNPQQVLLVLERLSSIEVEVSRNKIPVTFAAGWATPRAGELVEQVLERADQALYARKSTYKQHSLTV